MGGGLGGREEREMARTVIVVLLCKGMFMVGGGGSGDKWGMEEW